MDSFIRKHIQLYYCYCKVSDAERNIFIEFLERSCTAEFSGFLLYKELARRLQNSNPVLSECFLLMSRDVTIVRHLFLLFQRFLG